MSMETEICNLYKAGNSLSDISKELSINKSKVYRCLKKNEINTNKNSSHYIKKLYDYEIDDSFFEKIDTEEKAYILGFLYADGNLHKKYYHIKLKLQERDKYILEKINVAMRSNKPLYFHKKTKKEHQNQVSIVISNKKMYNDVINLGLYPNKTYDLNFKKVFDDKMFNHFLRGYFDGDGWISVYKTDREYFLKSGEKKINNREVSEVGFTGTEFMCRFLNKFFLETLQIKSYLKADKRTDYRIKSLRIRSHKDVKKFYEFIYKNSTIFLTRKRDKFNELKLLKK